MGTDWFLYVDFTVRCYSPTWTLFSVLAASAVALHIIGVPLFFFLLLTRARNHNVAYMWQLINSQSGMRTMWVQFAMREREERNKAGRPPDGDAETRLLVTSFLKLRNLDYFRTRDRLGFLYARSRAQPPSPQP